MDKFMNVKLSTISGADLLRALAMYHEQEQAGPAGEVLLIPISGGAQDVQFKIWIDGVDSVHTLTIHGNGTWTVHSKLEV